MTSDEINKVFYSLENSELTIGEFTEDTGKVLPYIGWFWRTVQWDKKNLSLGYCECDKPFIGFMENNKWGYPEFYLSEKETKRVRDMAEKVAKLPNETNLKEFFLFIQSLAHDHKVYDKFRF